MTIVWAKVEREGRISIPWSGRSRSPVLVQYSQSPDPGFRFAHPLKSYIPYVKLE